MIRKDLTNQKFGKLIVIKYFGKAKDGHSIWQCKCECGNIVNVSSNSLKNNNTKSCGCLSLKIKKSRNKEKCNFYKHGKTKTRLFNIWHSMKQRCLINTNRNYKLYGGRGIKICNEWLNKENGFINFYNWAINNGYKDNLTIDRINNNGDYKPNNCRWVSQKQQSNNRRTNHYITYNGETHTIAEWSDITKIKSSTISKRINKYKWSIEKSLTTEVKNTKK